MKFELPFNLNCDHNWFNLLERNRDKFEFIDCVYMPCYEIGYTTREESIHRPKTEKEYAALIEKLKTYELPINVLMDKDATFELVKKYIDTYGISIFTINDDELAIRLKSEYPNIKLYLSHTRKITPEELETGDFSMYDVIGLFFWYNRHLDIVNNLPNTYQYLLSANSTCLWNCPFLDEHWFNGKENKWTKCTYSRYINNLLNMKTVAYIRPNDTFRFNVNIMKLQGRDSSSIHIFRDLTEYINQHNAKNLVNYTPDVYNITD